MQSLPEATIRRLEKLTRKCERGTLTQKEQDEYRKLARLVQKLDVVRVAALADLSRRCKLVSTSQEQIEMAKAAGLVLWSDVRCRDSRRGRIVLIELELPKDWQKFRLPRALNDRLEELVDREDREGKLPRRELREAQALTKIADLFAIMRLGMEWAANQ